MKREFSGHTAVRKSLDPFIEPESRHRHVQRSLDQFRKVKKVGRRRWKKEFGYHRQSTVENAFFRHKSILGDRLRARHPKGQEAEALIACNVLNRMFELGRPVSVAIGS